MSMQTRSTPFTYKAFVSDFMEIVRTHGVLNLWRGNLMNVVKVFPYAAIVVRVLIRILHVSIF